MTNPPNNEKLLENSVKLSPYFENLLHNLDNYLNTKDMSLREFAEKADIPLETLRSIYYRKTNTCKLKTAIAIARQLGLSLDELTDSGLIDPITAESLRLAKGLTFTERELVRWFIRKTVRRHEKHPGKHMVTIMNPICSEGALKSTNDYSAIDVSKFPPNVLQTAFFGIIVPCEHYMPHYVKGQTLLLSLDRKPRLAEHCIVSVDNNIYIASYFEEQGKPVFKSIINKRPFPFSVAIDDVVGYISYVIEE